MLLTNTQNQRDVKFALSISPFLVLDDNTRICRKHTTKMEWLPLDVCMYITLHLTTNAQHVGREQLTKNLTEDIYIRQMD